MTTRIILIAGALLLASEAAFSLVVSVETDTELYAAQVPVIGTIKLGEIVSVVAEKGGWCKVRFKTASGEFSEGLAETDAFARKNNRLGQARRSTPVYALSRPVLATIPTGSEVALIAVTTRGYRARFIDSQGRELMGIIRASAMPDTDDVRAWREELGRAAETRTQVESPVTLKVGDGELRVRFQFTTLYIPANIPRGNDVLVRYSRTKQCGYSRFFFVGYRQPEGKNYQKPTEGFFRVNGKAEKLKCQSSNPAVVRVVGVDDEEGLCVEALAPGKANIGVSLAGRSVVIPLKVVQIPVRAGDFHIEEYTGVKSHTRKDVIRILGLPDKRQESLVSWPEAVFYAGQHFGPPAGASWRIQRWTYEKYPGAEIIFVGNSETYYARSAQTFEVADTVE